MPNPKKKIKDRSAKVKISKSMKSLGMNTPMLHFLQSRLETVSGKNIKYSSIKTTCLLTVPNGRRKRIQISFFPSFRPSFMDCNTPIKSFWDLLD